MDKIDLTIKGADVIKEYKKQRDKGTYNEIFKKYKDPSTKYSFSVLEERELSNEMIKLDCFRHLNDLVRAEEHTDDFPYIYDLNHARNIINYAKLCPDVNTGKPLPLMLWQQSFLTKLIGWRKLDGTKRFSKAILSIARTNGKTYLSNILISYAFLIEADGLSNQDMAYIAPVSAQSDKGFRYIRTTFNYLASSIPDIKRRFKTQGIRVVDDKVASSKKENKLLKLSQESGQFDSYHLLFAISDEAGDNKHLGKIKENNGKITSGQVQTPNHQFLQISTAYPDSNSYLYHDEKMLREVMERDYERVLDDYLCVVYQQDTLKETENPEMWVKSNPVLALNGKDDMLTSLISERDTFSSQGKLAEFQNKNLNLWLQTKENTYLDLNDIENAVVDEPPIDINGKEVYIGWDLSHFSDDTVVTFTFPYQEADGTAKFFILEHSWIPLARAQNSLAVKMKMDGINYQKAEELGYATIANNAYGYIDEYAPYTFMLNFIHEHNLQVKAFNYDYYQTSGIITALEQKTDYQLMPLRQGTRSLNEPTTFFRKLMDMGRITYLNDPIILASLKNAVLKKDNNGVMVDKDLATAKIDFVDAVIDTFATAKYHFDDVDIFSVDEKSKSIWSGYSQEDIDDYYKNYSF